MLNISSLVKEHGNTLCCCEAQVRSNYMEQSVLGTMELKEVIFTILLTRFQIIYGIFKKGKVNNAW